jgi:branched-chain amino acid aminotransferase
VALSRDMGLAVEERRIALAELFAAAQDGTLEEAFGSGTASLTAPIGELASARQKIAVPSPAGSLAAKLREALSGIQRGEAPDRFGWMEKV